MKIIIIKPAAVHVNEILKIMGGNILQNNCEQWKYNASFFAQER